MVSKIYKSKFSYQLAQLFSFLPAYSTVGKIPTFFVLTPAEDELAKLDKSKVDQIDLTIDRLNFKMEQQDVKLICESSEDLLVDKMKFWAKEVA
ncbi:hypothetical protein [Acinetobacter pittii]|uniref:hypothetical protein n=1 Tax=Acinetobacter pittii TaxID=48296 RepID=UPI001EFE6DD7|nr:hypothetical protein [Acinetobacter pittii]MCG9504432.1 hypothetical protein [Acinetobacter pittii]